MKKLFILMICFISVNAFAQTEINDKFFKKYPFEYRLTIPDNPSYCFFNTDSTAKSVCDTNSCEIRIKVIDKSGDPLPFATLILTSSNKKSLIFYSDFNGIVKQKIPLEQYRLNIIMAGFTVLEKNIFPDLYRATTITAVMGESNSLTIPIVRSKRKLSEKEVIEITEDIRNGNKKSKLIENGTCSLSFEI